MILTNRYGQQDWIEQVVTGIKEAVQNGIELLSGSSIKVNSHPDDGYRFRARTKNELLESTHVAADSGQVDSRVSIEGVRDPLKAQQQEQPKGWLI